jgi:hypothetical protein
LGLTTLYLLESDESRSEKAASIGSKLFLISVNNKTIVVFRLSIFEIVIVCNLSQLRYCVAIVRLILIFKVNAIFLALNVEQTYSTPFILQFSIGLKLFCFLFDLSLFFLLNLCLDFHLFEVLLFFDYFPFSHLQHSLFFY